MSTNLAEHGFKIVPQVIGADEREALGDALGPVTAGAGRRGVLADPLVAQTARSERLLGLVRPHLPEEPVAVRAVYFNKSPDANWLVPWHQDLTIAVGARAEAGGFGPWSTKDGIPHVQPPAACLARMLTVRLHLDDADAANGALRVLPGSHQAGRLAAPQINAWRARAAEVLCAVQKGDALLMRPLLLHASGRSRTDRPRRVLHVEYAGFALPEGWRWHEAA